ncbi:uncharacterized protein LOC117190783 [Drosophila miranda]|uniref:uncharacterized protein LOC117190783 n=1 Tax=Drosophila miranda TaxID=7229 RepID=UPI00143F0DA6|nr:uncharacterized protein LOC117190783 [Drosophila miranda]
MYRQILVAEPHRNYQCILWRCNVSDRIQVLRLNTVTYGTNSAPFLAVRCLYYLVDRYAEKFPLAREAVKRSFYMDDMLCGAESKEELTKLKEQVTELLGLGKFELHKWRSNYQGMDNNTSLEPLMLKTEDAAKTLGIYWSSLEDKFQFCFNIKVSAIATKRSVLSELAQVFDPLGFLSPLLILGKIFVQELWLLKQDWDEELPASYATQWLRYREELKLIDKFSIPRSSIPITADPCTLQLFGFSDASNRAYGGVIYARVRDEGGGISERLVTAKSKVAPVGVTS